MKTETERIQAAEKLQAEMEAKTGRACKTIHLGSGFYSVVLVGSSMHRTSKSHK